MKYSANDLLTLGKRYNNPKRSYLLIDPLQAKHIPVSPSRALEMMHALGKKLREKVPDADCIIGFAETATAIAAAAASEFGRDTYFIHTTREEFVCAYYFSEEHSHASEQCLYGGIYNGRDGQKYNRVILIDDEFSTGKTLMNIIGVLKKIAPLKDAEFTAGSVINRIPAEKLREFADSGVEFVSLCDIRDDDFEERVSSIKISAPVRDYKLCPKEVEEFSPEGFGTNIGRGCESMRLGGKIGFFYDRAEDFAEKTWNYLSDKLNAGEKILVIGTEEFMYPALVLGKKIEEAGFEVYSHSTTRSPIGINNEENYPIKNGYMVHSFYSADRETYIYNTGKYDKIIIVTDSDREDGSLALRDITSVFEAEKFFLIFYSIFR